MSAKTYWCLARVAAAIRGSESPLDTPTTVDSLVEQLLLKYLAEAHPILLDMFEQREKINNDALAIVAEALKGKP